jgi:hypothetical protein
MMQRLPSDFAIGNGAGLRLKLDQYPATAVTGCINAGSVIWSGQAPQTSS